MRAPTTAFTRATRAWRSSARRTATMGHRRISSADSGRLAALRKQLEHDKDGVHDFARAVTPAATAMVAPRAGAHSYAIETYGCQMNVADSEIVHSVLQGAGYPQAPSVDAADIVLINTCTSEFCKRR